MVLLFGRDDREFMIPPRRDRLGDEGITERGYTGAVSSSAPVVATDLLLRGEKRAAALRPGLEHCVELSVVGHTNRRVRLHRLPFAILLV